MHLQFCGAAGEVTGSCTKLDVENSSILIDCGLFQGSRLASEKNFDPFPFKPEDIDAVILTHAHLDHCGRLPKLINQGFAGKIYATDATRDLTVLILLDAAHIMGDEAERHDHPTLYTEEDVVHTMERFMPLPYDKEIKVATGVTATFHNAGHVLGSSFIEVKGEGKTLIFSGDIGNHPVPLLIEPDDLPQADGIILESTYGDRTHGHYDDGIAALEEAIKGTIRERGVLLIPAFSLERTQELIRMIDEMITDHRIPAISAYLDGPLGIKISRVYDKYDHMFNDETQKLEAREEDHSVLTFKSLTITETAAQSKMINEVDPPKLIIAGSGMMQGGRILHHLKRYLPLENTRVFVAGFQVEGSLGRRLLTGDRTVTIHGEQVVVNAKILGTQAFSSHMDKTQLVEWLRTMKHLPKAVFLNHGDDDARAAFSAQLREELGIKKVLVPNYGDGFTITDEEDEVPAKTEEVTLTA